MPEQKNERPRPRLDLWALWIGVISGIIVIVGYFVPWERVLQWVGLSPTYTYELAGVRSELYLGQSETVGILRRAENVAEAVEDLECRWRYVPVLPGLPTGTACRITITDLPAYFGGAGPSDIPLTITVDLWRKNASGGSAIAQLSATTTLRYSAVPTVGVSAENVLAGHRLTVDVKFPPEGRPTTFSCSWTPADHFADPASCATDYIADAVIDSDRPAKLEVDVRGPGGTSLGTASQEIYVRTPPIHYMLYVMDDTAKVALSASNGVPLLAVMRRDLLSSLSVPSAGIDRLFGLFIFGGPLPAGTNANDPAADCARFGALYPLGRLDVEKAGRSLQTLHPEGQRAPLIAAIAAALEAYRPYQNQLQVRPGDRFTLTILTASTDDCDPQGVKSFLSALSQSLSQRELKGIYYDNRLLPIMLRMVDPGDVAARALLATEDYRNGEQPLAILLVTDTGILADALAAIAELSAGDAETRNHGCRALLQMFQRQGDEAGAARIRRFCG